MTLTEIRWQLQNLRIRPSRRLGQNFLHDQNVARRIVELATIRPDDSVIEIGPGLGAITKYILQQKPKLILIEKDPRLVEFLLRRFSEIQIIKGDALHEISNFKFQISNSIILGNLPYSIASPLMVRLCETDLRPQRMLFTVQLEVAKRLVAQPHTHGFGLLTLLTQPFYQIKMVRKVPSKIFWPQPKVNSAVVTLLRRSSQPFAKVEVESTFRRLVHQAFQKRRKTLGAIFGKESLHGINPRRRPEELDVDEWVALSIKQTNLKEEIFAVVNEQDEVIGQEQRNEVHQRSLWHRAVHIFIWNQHGQLLLQKRSPTKDVAPNTWDSSVAGHVGVGEDYDKAAHREMAEELGITLPLCQMQKFKACKELGWEFVWLYEGQSEGPFRFPKNEISELHWWAIQEINRTLQKDPSKFAPSFQYLWKQVAQSCNRKHGPS